MYKKIKRLNKKAVADYFGHRGWCCEERWLTHCQLGEYEGDKVIACRIKLPEYEEDWAPVVETAEGELDLFYASGGCIELVDSVKGLV